MTWTYIKSTFSCWTLSVLLVFTTGCSRCGGGGKRPQGGSVQTYQQRDGAENLREFFRVLQATLERGEIQAAAQHSRSVIPSKTRARWVLLPTVTEVDVDRIVYGVSRFAGNTEERAARMFAIDRSFSEVNVIRSTTEDILRGEGIGAELTDSQRELLRSYLRPGMTFYNVKFSVPGGGDSRTLSMFYWDGVRWTTLGELWRTLTTLRIPRTIEMRSHERNQSPL